MDEGSEYGGCVQRVDSELECTRHYRFLPLGDHHKIDRQQAANPPKLIVAHLATSHPFTLSDSSTDRRSSLYV